MEQKICISCKRKVVNDVGMVTFACPSCAKHTIVRCKNCKVNATKYQCPMCHFVGPN